MKHLLILNLACVIIMSSRGKKQVPFAGNKTKYGPFGTHIRSGAPFIDKTRFIVKTLSRGLFTPQLFAVSKPRKCGKSMNLDMLREFLRPDRPASERIFKDWEIMKEEYASLRNEYMYQTPVIFVDFSTVGDQPTFDAAKKELHKILCKLCKEFEYFFDSDSVSDYRKSDLKKFINTNEFDEIQDTHFLDTLTKVVCDHYQRPPVIIFDECDSPVAGAALHGYLPEMESLMRQFFLVSLKYNQGFLKAVLAGVQPIERHLPNNVRSYKMQDEKFATDFGFTKKDVGILVNRKPSVKADEIFKWFSYFKVGSEEIYNPASVIASFNDGWGLKTYSTPSSFRPLTKHIMTNMGLLPVLNLQVLLTGASLTKCVAESVNFRGVLHVEPHLWAYLLNAGVVASDEQPSEENECNIEIYITGKDMKGLLEKQIEEARAAEPDEAKKVPRYELLKKYLKEKNIDGVRRISAQYIDDAGEYLFHGNKETVEIKALAKYVKLIATEYQNTYGGETTVNVTENAFRITFRDKDMKKGFYFSIEKSPARVSAPKPSG